jgi:hypothetical protein
MNRFKRKVLIEKALRNKRLVDYGLMFHHIMYHILDGDDKDKADYSLDKVGLIECQLVGGQWMVTKIITDWTEFEKQGFELN